MAPIFPRRWHDRDNFPRMTASGMDVVITFGRIGLDSQLPADRRHSGLRYANIGAVMVLRYLGYLMVIVNWRSVGRWRAASKVAPAMAQVSDHLKLWWQTR